ncbi:MAG: hypothetical protein ABI462_12500 [Ignavibacteria bacterium]
MVDLKPKDSPMVKQISFIIVVRRVKTLAIAIIVGIVAIYLVGLFVVNANVKENFEIINLLTLILLIILVPGAVFLRKTLLKKVTMQNFQNNYFSAHIIPFAVIDFGSLFCITTNLFVNGNILYASIGLVIAIAGFIACFPKEEDFENLRSDV